ncbi:MAG: DUF2092 domain-containing protein [Geminicoccaceae bacterium]
MLREMGAYLAAADAFTVRADVTFDHVLPTGQKLQFAATEDLAVQRPNKVHVDWRSDLGDRQLWYDGKAVTLTDPSTPFYAVQPAPASLDATLDMIQNELGFSPPLGDFLYADPYRALRGNVRYGVDLGTSEIGGRTCRSLAFVDSQIEWQIWIAAGPQPVPRKLPITYLSRLGRPQFAAVFSDWNLALRIAESTFVPDLGQQHRRYRSSSSRPPRASRDEGSADDDDGFSAHDHGLRPGRPDGAGRCRRSAPCRAWRRGRRSRRRLRRRRQRGPFRQRRLWRPQHRLRLRPRRLRQRAQRRQLLGPQQPVRLQPPRVPGLHRNAQRSRRGAEPQAQANSSERMDPADGANTLQQNRFNEANSLQQNRTNEVNSVQQTRVNEANNLQHNQQNYNNNNNNNNNNNRCGGWNNYYGGFGAAAAGLAVGAAVATILAEVAAIPWPTGPTTTPTASTTSCAVAAGAVM